MRPGRCTALLYECSLEGYLVDWFAMAGTFCLGIVVMWIVRLFVVKLEKPELTWLTALLTALFGGAAIGLLGKFSQNGIVWPKEFWFYPIGLAVGLFLFSDAMKKEMDRPGS
jgi:hypothetical protein